MNSRLKRTVLALALAAASGTAAAAPSVDELLKRIEELERRQHGVDEALESERLSEKEPELVMRLKDVEFRTLSLQKQARTIDALEGVTASFGMVMVGQNASKDTTVSGEGESHLNYRADVVVTLPGGDIGRASGSLFGQFRLGQGGGMLDLQDGFTSSNATTFQISGPPSDSTAVLAQAWYQLDVPIGGEGSAREPREHLEFNIGKMDPFLFFDQNSIADDETMRFMNSAFVHNPLLDAGGDVGVDDYGFTPGARLSYHNETGAPEWWAVSVGVFAAGEGAAFNDSFNAPFVIAQLETGRKFFGGLDGNYRLYGWSNGQASEFNDGLVSEHHTGWGVSADQRFGDAVTVFGRYGVSTGGTVKFDRALTLGAEFGGSYWERAGDAVGVAAGWLSPSDEYKAANPGRDKAEELVELFYRWRLNAQLAVTPDIQWVRNPAGDGSAKDHWFAGVRAAVNF
ncbi:MAG: transporter [Gammaproteobacteria bacterium HGW-Gammaproteobacteria-1]|jgi:hypothetical protein|nr:MAG: transporter [Gammaproteobacteria bacterium HGW-Gammaproteobacteria-1]